jgi:hypothetical protein
MARGMALRPRSLYLAPQELLRGTFLAIEITALGLGSTIGRLKAFEVAYGRIGPPGTATSIAHALAMHYGLRRA